jgi:hypothetical protein
MRVVRAVCYFMSVNCVCVCVCVCVLAAMQEEHRQACLALQDSWEKLSRLR